jgi:hypothetical protein
MIFFSTISHDILLHKPIIRSEYSISIQRIAEKLHLGYFKARLEHQTQAELEDFDGTGISKLYYINVICFNIFISSVIRFCDLIGQFESIINEPSGLQRTAKQILP